MSGPSDSWRPGGSYHNDRGGYDHDSYDGQYRGAGYAGQGRGQGRDRGRWEGEGRGRYDERESHNRHDTREDWERDVRDRERVPPPREGYSRRQHEDSYYPAQDRYADHQRNDGGYGYQDASVMRYGGQNQHAHAGLPERPTFRETPPAASTSSYEGSNAGPASELPQKPRKRMPSPPSQSVILIGIPPQVSEEDVKSFVDDFKADPGDPSPVDNVVIVRDKQTGESKRFGFVRFISLEHARAFVEANFDHVFWKSRGSHDITEDGIKIRLDYATVDKRPGETAAQARSNAPREPYVPQPKDLNDGSRDMGSTANKILLLRNLDPLTKEYDISRSLENLDASTQERVKHAQGPRRVILIKDKVTSASWCFAFAVYPDEECAKTAMRTIMDPAQFPTGYTIQQRLVAVTFARIGCFATAYAKTTWSFTDEPAEAASAAGKRQELFYGDDAAYASVFECPSYQVALERKQEEAAKADDVDAFFSALETDHPKPQEDIVKAPPKIDLNLAGVLGPPGVSLKDKKKGATELIISKKIAVDINKWNQKKAESELGPADVPAEPTMSLPTKPAVFKAVTRVPEQAPPQASTSTATPPLEPIFPLADTTDPKLPKCLLCQRQFKSLDVLKKHNEQSVLHKTNLGDASKVEVALQAVKDLAPAESSSASQYRDRALARREALNQPEHPQLPPSKKHKKNPDVPKPAVSATEKHIEESNIGSKLLAGMGWTAGSGLGSSQVGRADPVQAKAFVAGAGIGASRGVNASEQAADSWRGSEHGRNKARQRLMEEEARGA